MTNAMASLLQNSYVLARQGTQDEEKQNKHTTQYVLGTIIHN
jgi:hypothetical protein